MAVLSEIKKIVLFVVINTPPSTNYYNFRE